MYSLSETFQLFCDSCLYDRGYSQATIKSMRQCMTSFQSFSGVDLMLDFNRANIHEWIRYGRQIRKWKGKTVHIYLNYLQQFSNWCIDENYLDENPTKKIPRPKKSRNLPEFFTMEEKGELMQYVKNYPYHDKMEKHRAIAIFSVFLCSGLRKSELLNLCLGDVNLHTHSIFVRSGKGDKDRYVSFSPTLNPILEDWLKDRRRMRIKCPYFFTSIRNDKGICHSVLSRLFDKIQEASGFNLYAHKLRHTFASLSLQQGFTIREVQEMMGHSCLESTLIYLGVCNRQLHHKVLEKGLRAE